MKRFGITTLSALLLLACGGPSREPQAVERTKPTGALMTILEQHCGSCHQGGSGRPTFAATATLSRRDAIEAALMVSARRMPPPPTALSDSDRSQLVSDLCAYGGADPSSCGEPASEPTRSPDEVIRQADRVAPHNADHPAPTPAERHLRAYVKPTSRVVYHAPTLDVLRLLLASERCPRPETGDAESEAKYIACLHAILAPTSALVPEPAP